MATRRNFRERATQRREEAQVRKLAREERGDAGQLQRLEQAGFGEGREATRLRKKLG